MSATPGTCCWRASLTTAITILGGLGLFLLGMSLMTDGLKSMAGAGLRGFLARAVRGPISGVLTGAAATGLVQSSSATTMMTIGLVSAGLLTFGQAVGVVLGANVGTTSTSWLVALLGLKFSIGSAALPMIFAGAMLRMMGRGRAASAGMALAGFGLLFVGIGMLAGGMSGFAERFSPSDMPGATLAGRAALVGIGCMLTIVTQSSSVAAAATLSALHAGAIGLDQSMAMVVGQNIGTAVSSAVAAIGSTTPAKRTAVSHILFNVLTGAVVFLLLPVVTGFFVSHAAGDGGGGRLSPGEGLSPTILLAVFHTAFNVLGLVIVLPVLGPYTRLIERLVPPRGPALTRHLDRSVATMPVVAVEAGRRSVLEVAHLVMDHLAGLIRHREPPSRGDRLSEAESALLESGRFLAAVGRGEESGRAGDVEARRLAVLHAIDHLLRMIEACREVRSARLAADDPTMVQSREELLEGIATAMVSIRSALSGVAESEGLGAEAVRRVERIARDIAERRRRGREEVLALTASGGLSVEESIDRIEAKRWLDRAGYRVWRSTRHLLSPPHAGSMPESLEERDEVKG